MREKPMLLMLHGGPGSDHSIYRPAYSALADIAQIVYLDHRGNGRSEDGPREGWNWRNGATTCAPSATRSASSTRSCWAPRSAAWSRWPTPRAIRPPSKLILISTEAAGGSYRSGAWRCSSASAGRRWARWHAAGFWSPSPWDQAQRDAWLRLAMPVYTAGRAIRIWDAARSNGRRWGCTGLPGPAARATASTCSRTSIVSSARPSCWAARTIRCIRSRVRRIIAAALPPHLVRFERFAELRARRHARCARTDDGSHPRIHHEALD